MKCAACLLLWSRLRRIITLLRWYFLNLNYISAYHQLNIEFYHYILFYFTTTIYNLLYCPTPFLSPDYNSEGCEAKIKTIEESHNIPTNLNELIL